jgi:hypothetical protein
MEEARQSLALEVGEARNADAVLGRIAAVVERPAEFGDPN